MMSLRSKLRKHEANLIQEEIESIPPPPTIAPPEPPIVENTPEKSTICTTKTTDSRSSMKQTITDYYSPKSQPKQDQGTKRKSDSPQEKGPVPPGTTGCTSKKSIVLDTENDDYDSKPS